MIKQIDLNFEGTARLLFSCDKPFLHCAIQEIALYIPFMLEKFKKCFFYQENISNVRTRDVKITLLCIEHLLKFVQWDQ